MSIHIENMGVRHTNVSIAEPGTLLGEDTVKGWALVLSVDNVTVIEGFKSHHEIAEWLIALGSNINKGSIAIEEGDE